MLHWSAIFLVTYSFLLFILYLPFSLDDFYWLILTFPGVFFFLSCVKTTDERLWVILHLIPFYLRVCDCVILSFIDHLSAPATHLVLNVFYLSIAVFNVLITFTLNSNNSNLCYIWLWFWLLLCHLRVFLPLNFILLLLLLKVWLVL